MNALRRRWRSRAFSECSKRTGRSYWLDRASAVGGVRPPFKPCVRISRTRLTKGHWEYDITQPPGIESCRAGDGDREPERSHRSIGRLDWREAGDRCA